jgi:hypothetical protein
MRAVFSILGLVLVLAIIGLLAKKQLAPTAVSPAAGSAVVTTPAATPQQTQQQVKQTVEGAMQGAMQARPMPDDK